MTGYRTSGSAILVYSPLAIHVHLIYYLCT